MQRELTCREAARLMFGAFETSLSASDSQALQEHIAECEACRRVRIQVDFMRDAHAAWRRYREV